MNLKSLKRDLTPIDKEIYSLELEKVRLNREKTLIVLDKGLMLYFVFILTAVLGYINHLVTPKILNLLIVLSFGVLSIILISYVRNFSLEEKTVNSLIRELRLRRGGK